MTNSAVQIAIASERCAVAIEEAVDLIGDGKVVTVGIGKAGHVAKKVAATFMSIGVRAQFLHPVEALHGDMGCVDEDKDVALVFSNTGRSPEIIEFVHRVNIPLVIVSGGYKGSLLADEVLIDIGKVDDRGFLPTASTSVMMAVGDAIAVGVMEKRGFNEEQFLGLHPGGGIGLL